MNVSILRLLFDFGLVILIWLVQLVIYPSFLFYSKEQLISWHRKYTVGISFVVIPLMFGQLIIAIIQLINGMTIYTISSMVLIILVWTSTFIQFVPMHNKIASGNSTTKVLYQLVKQNWLRTTLWTIIFICSALTFL